METLEQKIVKLNLSTGLEYLQHATKNSHKVVFSTSFGKEDQVITQMIAENKLPISIFTLDTGRLFEETYAIFDRTLKKYGVKIKAFYPNQTVVEKLVTEKGPYSFYNSIEDRKECCNIRKIEPLQRALKGAEIWITGLRKEQSANRESLKQVEWDATNKILKIHPLLNWSNNKLNSYIDKNNIPVNTLHKKGYPSIGCSSCTRAVQENEDERAGRWWWETSKKECGLHQ